MPSAQRAVRIGTRHHSGLRDRGVLDESTLELERADSVVRRLEHIVGARPIYVDVAIGVTRSRRPQYDSGCRAVTSAVLLSSSA